jgi:hypothetical protein
VDSNSIRVATKDDLGQMVEMLHKFHDKSGVDSDLDLDSALIALGVMASMETLFICETGIIGYQGGSIWYTGDKVAQVVLIWSERPGTGVRLLKHAVKEAKKQGYKYFQCNSLESLEPEKMNKVLEKMGFA